jgi:hypothetical protein
MKQKTKQTAFRQTKEEFEQLKNDAHAHQKKEVTNNDR